MVYHVQLQAALTAVVLRLGPAFELILSAGHDHKAQVGPLDNALEEVPLDIGLQGYALLAGERAVSRVGQGAYPGILLLQPLQIISSPLDILQRGLISDQTGMDVPLLLRRLGPFPR